MLHRLLPPPRLNPAVSFSPSARPRLRFPSFVLIGVGAWLAQGHCFAASTAWTGTNYAADPTWGTPGATGDANWSPTNVPGSSSGTVDPSTAVFSTATGYTISLPAYLNIDNITFSGAAGAFDLTQPSGGGTLYLTTSGSITDSATSSTTQTIDSPIVVEGAAYKFSNSSTTSVLNFTANATIASAGTAYVLTLAGNNANPGINSIAGVISNVASSFPVSVTGGNWLFAGANTYSGVTTISGGANLILDTYHGGSLANSVIEPVGGTLTLQGSSSASAKTSTTISGLNVQNGFGLNGAIVFNDNSGVGQILNLTTFNQTNLPSLLNITLGANDTITSTNTTTANTGGGLLNANFNVGGTLFSVVLNGTDLAGTTNTSGTVTVGAAAYTPITTTAFPTSATATPEFTSNSPTTVSLTSGTAYTTGSIAMKDTSPHTIALNGDTLTFGTAASKSGNIFSASGSGALTVGSVANDGTITANGAGVLYLTNDSSNALTVNSKITGSAALDIAGSGSGATVVNGTNTYTGNTYLSGTGPLDINSSTALGAGGTTGIFYLINPNTTIDNTSGAAVTLTNNNAIVLGGNLTYGGTNSLDLGSGAVTVRNLANGSTITITTNGSGTLALDGAISAANVNIAKQGSGTLALNGTATALGTVTVNAGTLTGIGTLPGALTLNSGGNITPGNPTNGTAMDATTKLSAASMTFNAGGMLTYVLNSGTNTDTTSNNLALTGALTKGTGTGNYTISLTGGNVGQTYDLMNYGSTTFTVSTTVPNTQFTALGDTGTFFVTGNELEFDVTGVSTVPEPATSTAAVLISLMALCSPQGRALWKRGRRA